MACHNGKGLVRPNFFFSVKTAEPKGEIPDFLIDQFFNPKVFSSDWTEQHHEQKGFLHSMSGLVLGDNVKDSISRSRSGSRAAEAGRPQTH